MPKKRQDIVCGKKGYILLTMISDRISLSAFLPQFGLVILCFYSFFEILDKCRRLWEYSELSSEIEENIGKGMRREEAVHTAVDTCIERGILKDILLAEKGMVLHMLLTEYDEKKHLKNTFEEGRKKGLEEGIERKLSDQVQKKIAKGKTISEIAEELEEEISVIERLVSRNRKS